MSFGVVQAMISSLKNNKRTRPSAFKKLKDSDVEYRAKTELHFEKKMTPAELSALGKRIKKERQLTLIKRIVLFAVVMVGLIAIIGFMRS